MKKIYKKLVQEKRVLVKNKKKYEIRKFDEKVWDVLAEEPNRRGLTFDVEFFDEQRVTWERKMEESVNPEFIKEVEENNNLKQAKAKKKKSQYASFETASSSDLDQAIHQGRLGAKKAKEANFLLFSNEADTNVADEVETEKILQKIHDFEQPLQRNP